MADESPNGKYVIETSDDGVPVMFAVRAPGQVAAQRTSSAIVTRAARSGNPQFDPSSGRFAGSGTTRVEQTPEIIAQATRIPSGVDPDAWERKMDVVREIARQLLDFDDDSLTNFLSGHPSVQDIDAIDLNSLKADVRAQQLDDLVDIVDTQLKSRVDVRRNVRLQSPRGWIKKAIARFTDDEILDVAKRLEGRGFGDEVIRKQVVEQITDEDRRKKLEQVYGEQSRLRRREKRQQKRS